MILALCLSFTLLLFLGMPIAVMLAATTALALALYTNTPLTILVQQLFNALDNFVLLSVPFFMLAGGIMSEGALAGRLVAVINLVMGRHRGGLALAAVLACLFFAAISGSSPATVVAIGGVMLPALIKAGYPKNFSLGLITSAGSLGIVIPPSIPMILYCLVMNVSVAKLFMAGFLPGFLIGGTFMAYAWLLARKKGWRTEAAAPTRQEAARVLKEGVWALMLPVLVLGGIYAGIFTPTEAAAVSVVYALGVEMLVYRELTWTRLMKVCRDSAMLSACLLFILACSMAFVWLLTAERIPMAVADWIVGNVHSGFMFLAMVTLLFLLLGMVMDDVSAMLILAPIFGETLQRYGIDLVHFGIVMVLLIEYGFLTPPFGLNLFVTMGLTGESLTTVSRAVAPFLLLLLACVLLVIFIPEISLFLPKTLLPHIK